MGGGEWAKRTLPSKGRKSSFYADSTVSTQPGTPVDVKCSTMHSRVNALAGFDDEPVQHSLANAAACALSAQKAIELVPRSVRSSRPSWADLCDDEEIEPVWNDTRARPRKVLL